MQRRGPFERLWLVLTLILGLAGGVGAWPALAAAATSAAGGPAIAAPEALELPSLPASARGEAVFEGEVPQLRARLLRSSGAAPRIGVLFELAPGWHVYWRNPGGTGLAPELGLSAEGHEIGEIAWPAPRTFAEADGLFTTWGYEESVLLSAPIRPAPEGDGDSVAEPGARAAVQADLRVLICRTQCVPAELSLSAPLAPRLTATEQTAVDARFREALARVPVSASTLGLEARAHWQERSPGPDESGTALLRVEACGSHVADCPRLDERGDGSLFVPREGATFELAAARVLERDAAGRAFTLGIELDRLEPGADRLAGLVPLVDAEGRSHHVSLDLPIESSEGVAAAASQAGRADTGGGLGAPEARSGDSVSGTTIAGRGDAATGPTATRWLQIVLLAMLGGLILNGMPCVLPVLAIKVVAVADLAQKHPREVRLHGLAYTGGVLASMAALAAVVLALRAAGHSVGWGFQFQEPLFVAVICAVLVTFALNLFGVFEIELGQGRLATVGQQATGLRRSAFEGLLAVVLATPCTAPFLGTAVGFAFASSGLGIAAIFLAIGLGLASPFLAVSFAPRLARFVPRSGPWMNTLRAGLGFSLLATVVWLLWVLGQGGGVDAVVEMVGALLLLAFLLWTFGRLQPMRSAWLGRLAAVSIAAIAFTSFNLIGLERGASKAAGDGGIDAHSASGAGAAEQTGWHPYSEDAVAEVLASGQPAFVVFTADWCITCKVNEKTVLEREAVRAAFERLDFALFVADWTHRDEAIRRRLADFGRAGVPLYLVYRPDAPDEPRVLSELLSRREVLAALETAAAPASRRGV